MRQLLLLAIVALSVPAAIYGAAVRGGAQKHFNGFTYLGSFTAPKSIDGVSIQTSDYFLSHENVSVSKYLAL